MSCMIDRYHDAYHAEEPDYVNCPYCQDELILTDPASAADTLPMLNVEMDAKAEWGAWLEMTLDPDVDPVDRLEDLDV